MAELLTGQVLFRGDNGILTVCKMAMYNERVCLCVYVCVCV